MTTWNVPGDYAGWTSSMNLGGCSGGGSGGGGNLVSGWSAADPFSWLGGGLRLFRRRRSTFCVLGEGVLERPALWAQSVPHLGPPQVNSWGQTRPKLTNDYCRERLFVALHFRKGDFGAPLTHLAMRRIILLVLILIKKSTTIKVFWKKSCPQRRIKRWFCTTLPSFAMRRLFWGPTLLHVRLIFIPPRNPEVLVWTNTPSLLLDFRSPHPPSLLLYLHISEKS